jgi:predicted AAA+ superfamily ATPase
MIPRQQKHLIRSRLELFPAVAVLGPRQCGKTTLAKQLGGRYFDLEQEGKEPS